MDQFSEIALPVGSLPELDTRRMRRVAIRRAGVSDSGGSNPHTCGHTMHGRPVSWRYRQAARDQGYDHFLRLGRVAGIIGLTIDQAATLHDLVVRVAVGDAGKGVVVLDRGVGCLGVAPP